MAEIFSKLQQLGSSVFDWFKNWFSSSTKNGINWKYVGMFCTGGICGVLLSFNYAKKLTCMNGKQLIGAIATRANAYPFNSAKYNDPSEWKKIIPTAPTRPSNELLALVTSLQTVFVVKPEWTPREHVQHSQALFAQVGQFAKLCPSYVPNPEPFKHVINANNNVNAYELRYPGCDASNGVILYIHGGGFLVGRWDFSLQVLSPICRQTGMLGMALDFRLVNGTEVTIEQQVNDCVEAYQYILDKYGKMCAGKVYICGESGGAALAMLTLLEIKNRASIPQPRGVIAMSPICDLSLDAKSVAENEQFDIIKVVACTKAFQVAAGNMDLDGNIIGNTDLKSGKFSCRYADFQGVTSSVYVQASAYEILRDDIREMVKNAKKCKVPMEYEESLYCPHGVACFAGSSPETHEATVRVTDWIKALNKQQ